MSKIGCTVQSCKHWQNDLCSADEIMVNLNERYESTDMEIGSMSRRQNNAQTSPETQCTTFVPRG